MFTLASHLSPLRRLLAAAAIIGVLSLGPQPSWAGDLNQVVEANEEVIPAGELSEFRSGHADIGPLLVDPAGESGDSDAASSSPFDIFIRDDSAVPPVWRHFEDMLIVVGDNARQTLPDSQEFSFIGVDAGKDVWVIPQVEQVGVPWLGWSTQSPAFVAAVNGGVTMRFVGHHGPGQFSLFLQNGGFEQPQVVWNSADDGAQDLWVETNTHTHANWVFTEPGIHQVAIEMSATLTDGTEATATQVVSFAVGDGVDLALAHSTEWEGDFLTATDAAATGESATTAGDNEWVLWALIGVVAVVVVASLVAVFAALKRGGSR